MLKAKTIFSGFAVDDLEKAKQFYTQKLGLTVSDETMGLHLQLPSGATIFVYARPNHEPASYTILNFAVDDIDAAVDQLAGQGVVFERYPNMPAPQDEKGILRGRSVQQGPDIAWFKDPAGNICAVLQDT
ncbi:MAG TPA: VOC family protein [Candidatus Saccharimonadales bacterium]|nr:VOC family protein [Candidatus Saccharimonadales bacterium]